MGEQRTGVVGGTSDYIATRDAFDTSPGARKVERVDFSSDHLPGTFVTSLYRSLVTSSAVVDGTDATSFGTSSGTLSVGDKSGLAISAITYSNTGQVTVVPLYYDSAMALMFAGDEVVLVAGAVRRGTEAGSPYLAPARLLDSLGASYARFMVKSCIGTISICAGVI